MAGSYRSKESIQGKRRMSISIDEEMYKELEEVADENKLSVSAQIARIIQEYIKNKEDHQEDKYSKLWNEILYLKEQVAAEKESKYTTRKNSDSSSEIGGEGSAV